MSLVPIDVKASLDAGGQATYQSGASNSQSLNLNPAFLFGGGTLSSSPSGATDSNVSPTQVATPTNISTPFANGPTPGVPGVALPGGASPFATSSGNSSWLWIVLALGVILLIPEGRHR